MLVYRWVWVSGLVIFQFFLSCIEVCGLNEAVIKDYLSILSELHQTSPYRQMSAMLFYGESTFNSFWVASFQYKRILGSINFDETLSILSELHLHIRIPISLKKEPFNSFWVASRRQTGRSGTRQGKSSFNSFWVASLQGSAKSKWQRQGSFNSFWVASPVRYGWMFLSFYRQLSILSELHRGGSV